MDGDPTAPYRYAHHPADDNALDCLLFAETARVREQLEQLPDSREARRLRRRAEKLLAHSERHQTDREKTLRLVYALGEIRGLLASSISAGSYR